VTDRPPTDSAATEARPARRRSWVGWTRGDTRVYLVLCAAGIAVGVLWRLLGPALDAAGQASERGVAVDGTLALLQLLAGLVTGGVVIATEGRSPVRRGLLGIAGSLVAAGLSLLTGLALGGPLVQAPAAALVWPVITALVIFTGTLIGLIGSDRHERRAASPYAPDTGSRG
jgi:hypothetical protein